MGSRYGVDVAVVRADDLDRKMITYVQEHEDVTVLDLGSGAGGQSYRLAHAGADVLAFDFGVPVESCAHANIEFIQKDIRSLSTMLVSQQFSICCFQRTIHYLRYQEAMLLLQQLYASVRDCLFISVSGLESDIGLYYCEMHTPIQNRFGTLDQTGMSLFSIEEPVCLYTPEEFIQLLRVSGWYIEECWISAFGNIKAICRKC